MHAMQARTSEMGSEVRLRLGADSSIKTLDSSTVDIRLLDHGYVKISQSLAKVILCILCTSMDKGTLVLVAFVWWIAVLPVSIYNISVR